MKILIVDDHALIREALRGVLASLQDGAEILEAANSGRAMKLAEENSDLELVLLDLYLPDRNGFDVLAELRKRYPAVCVVVLSASSDRKDIRKALDLGAQGFIPKSARRQVMLGAFELIFAGGIYVPPEILPGHLSHLPSPDMPPQSGGPPSAAELGLTQRQMDVLTLMMEGKSNKAICRVLNVAEPTVKNHVTAILKALNANNRTEAVIEAGARGLTRNG